MPTTSRNEKGRTPVKSAAPTTSPNGAAHRLIEASFRGSALFVVDNNGQPYVPMRPVVAGMGLDWKSQHAKLSGDRFKTCVVEITMRLPGDTQRRNTTCMALRKLPGWLTTISANKVRPELREKIVAYQRQADDILWDAWQQARHGVARPLEESDAPSTVADRRPLYHAVADMVIERHVSPPVANRTMNRYAGVKRMADMSKRDVVHTVHFADRYNSGTATPADFARIEHNTEKLDGVPPQLGLFDDETETLQ
jgi:hypothetical protein